MAKLGRGVVPSGQHCHTDLLRSPRPSTLAASCTLTLGHRESRKPAFCTFETAFSSEAGQFSLLSLSDLLPTALRVGIAGQGSVCAACSGSLGTPVTGSVTSGGSITPRFPFIIHKREVTKNSENGAHPTGLWRRLSERTRLRPSQRRAARSRSPATSAGLSLQSNICPQTGVNIDAAPRCNWGQRAPAPVPRSTVLGHTTRHTQGTRPFLLEHRQGTFGLQLRDWLLPVIPQSSKV